MSKSLRGNTETVTPVEPSSAHREPSEKEKAWEQNTLGPTLAKSPERQREFTTLSDHKIRRLYTKADLPNWDAEALVRRASERARPS